VCAPNIKSFPEEFLTSFTAFYDLVFNFCEIFKEPVAFLPFPCPSTCFQNEGFNCLKTILNSFAPQPPFIWKIIHDFDSFPQNFKNPSHIPTCSQILPPSGNIRPSGPNFFENIEIRKNNLISSSTQSKEEFPCALCWDSLKLRGSRIFT